jgi:hypothetical protein
VLGVVYAIIFDGIKRRKDCGFESNKEKQEMSMCKSEVLCSCGVGFVYGPGLLRRAPEKELCSGDEGGT